MRKTLLLLIAVLIYSLSFGQVSIVDFGASPSKTGIENRNSINAAINSCNNCTITIPEGVFNVAKPTGGSGYYGLSSLVLDGKSNVTIKGTKQSVIKLEAGSYPGDTHIFYIRNSNNTTIEGITINGNRFSHSSSNEQMHGVVIFDSNSTAINNVDFIELRGDGVFAIGNTLSNNIKVNNCDFIRNGRSGITLQRLVKSVFITNNYFENINDQAIDSEPTGGVGYSVVSITGNIFTKDTYQNIMVSLGGSGSRIVSFSDNKILNGGLFVTSVIDCDINDNYIEGSISVLEASKNVTIESNHLKKDGGRLIYVYYQNGQPENFKILSNFLEGANVTNAIDVQSNGVRVSDNDIKLTSGSVGIKIGFPVTTSDDLDDVRVTNNIIRNVATGISFDGSATKKYRSATISDNVIQDFRSPKLITKGININGSSSYFFNDLTIHTNTYDASLTLPVSLNVSAVNYYKGIDGSLFTDIEPTLTAPNGTIAKHLVLPYRYKSSGNGWSEIDYEVKNQVYNTKSGINFTGSSVSLPYGGWVSSPEIVATSLTSSRAMYVINSVANGNIQALLRSNASPEFGGIVFRMKDATNYWLFRVSATKTQVVKRSGGSDIVVFETSNIYREYIIMSVEFRDSLIDFYVNGRKITSISDDFNKESVAHGVYSNVINRYYFSDIVIGL